MFPESAGEVAFGGSDGFFGCFAFLGAAGDVVGCFFVVAGLGDDDGVEDPVDAAVAAAVEPVALLFA